MTKQLKAQKKQLLLQKIAQFVRRLFAFDNATIASNHHYKSPNDQLQIILNITRLLMASNKQSARYLEQSSSAKALKVLVTPNLLSLAYRRELEKTQAPNPHPRKPTISTISSTQKPTLLTLPPSNLPPPNIPCPNLPPTSQKSSTNYSKNPNPKPKLNASVQSTNSTADDLRKEATDYRDLDEKHSRLQDRMSKLREKFIRKTSSPLLKAREEEGVGRMGGQRLKTEPCFHNQIVEEDALCIMTDVVNNGSIKPQNLFQHKSNYYVKRVIEAVDQPQNSLAKQHLQISLQVLTQIKNIEKPSLKLLQDRRIILPRHPHNLAKKTLVLDLDETLFHFGSSSLSSPTTTSLTLSSGKPTLIHINIRPFAQQFLQMASKLYQIIIFTASNQNYADPVINTLDPEGKFVAHRLYRQSCWVTKQGRLVKDLRVLANRQLEDMVIVDNSPMSYAFQLENGVPIVAFIDDDRDCELKGLLGYLEELVEEQDVRVRNIEHFKLDRYREYGDINNLVNGLYK